jgi:hypothetical protein
VLEQFKQSLIIKNVAQEIAENLCESVGTSLVGKKLGTFTRVQLFSFSFHFCVDFFSPSFLFYFANLL